MSESIKELTIVFNLTTIWVVIIVFISFIAGMVFENQIFEYLLDHYTVEFTSPSSKGTDTIDNNETASCEKSA